MYTVTDTLILGSYTKKDSKGIYRILFDSAEGSFSTLEELIKEDNPTYLAHSEKETLYSVTKEEGKGGLASYKLMGDGTYQLINRVTSEGAPPCYVAVDNKRQLVFDANYHKGTISTYRIQTDGSLSLVDTVQHNGSGPHDNQTVPHAHYADLTPDNRLVACDLGTDTVYTYDVSEEGYLTEVATFKAQPGTGPRHLVFHPNNSTAYLFGELSSDVVVLSYDAVSGSFTEKQVISTLPVDYTDFNGGAAIRLSQDGDFLYVSNRGHDSIAVYKTSMDGTHLELIQLISVEGDFPRDFDITPDGHWLIVANQNTDNLTLFSRNMETGILTLAQKDIYAPEIVCVTFK